MKNTYRCKTSTLTPPFCSNTREKNPEGDNQGIRRPKTALCLVFHDDKLVKSHSQRPLQRHVSLIRFRMHSIGFVAWKNQKWGLGLLVHVMAQFFFVLISYYAATISQHFKKKMSKRQHKRSPQRKTIQYVRPRPHLQKVWNTQIGASQWSFLLFSKTFKVSFASFGPI